MIENLYKREITGEDQDLLQVRVPYGINKGKVRVITQPDCGCPVWLTIAQVKEAIEALSEAVFAAEAMAAADALTLQVP